MKELHFDSFAGSGATTLIVKDSDTVAEVQWAVWKACADASGVGAMLGDASSAANLCLLRRLDDEGDDHAGSVQPLVPKTSKGHTAGNVKCSRVYLDRCTCIVQLTIKFY